MRTIDPMTARSSDARRFCSTTLCLGLLAAPVAAAAAGAAAPAAPAPVATLRPDKGFIDDPMVFSPDGQTLYYIATDGATFAELRAARVTPGAAGVAGTVRDTLSVPGLPLTVSRLLLLPAGSADAEPRVLVIFQQPAGTREAEGTRETGVVYALGKKPGATRERLGPATAISLGAVGGAAAVLALTQPAPQARGGEVRVQAVATATFRPLSQRAYRVRPDDGQLLLGAGAAAPLYLADDFQTLAVKQSGAFDKKMDVRQPDRLALLDALTGKVQKDAPIADPVALLELSQVRARHPGETIFLNLDVEKGRLELIGAPGGDPAAYARRVALTPPRPLSRYEPTSLRYQALPGARVFFSLTVDPLNEAAVARKKRDADTIDLCVAEVGAGQARCPASLPGQERPSTWAISPTGRLGLLRKHRGFSRGGTEVEVYDLDVSAGAEVRP